MCIEVFLACDAELPVEPDPVGPPDPHFGVFACPPRAAPLRALLALPNVYYIGAHTGCGCGFNSGNISWQGVGSAAEAVSLLDAMTTDERVEFVAEQRSREQLSALLRQARSMGRVALYGCWWGDEALASLAQRQVEAGHFSEAIEPIEERTLFQIA